MVASSGRPLVGEVRPLGEGGGTLGGVSVESWGGGFAVFVCCGPTRASPLRFALGLPFCVFPGARVRGGGGGGGPGGGEMGGAGWVVS